jgi:hypothetical protein
MMFMPRVEFEPTISAFERAKTVHALDRAAPVIFLCDDCVYSLVDDNQIINNAKFFYSASKQRNRCGRKCEWNEADSCALVMNQKSKTNFDKWASPVAA